jgi:GT2 family glycosyltransferase
MTISILIPNHNGRQLLATNLPKIKKVKGVKEIIVVDDHSEDGSVEFIRKELPEIKVIEKTGSKRGFSSTVNFGLKSVNTDLVALINSDVVPEKDCLGKAAAYFSDPELFAVGFLDRSHENGKILLRGRGIAQWKNGFYQHARGNTDQTDTAWVSGGSGIFRISILRKLGGFDELFDPFYWEDIDLSYRARKSGYKIRFARECRVDHYHEQGAIRSEYPPPEVKVIAFRNELIFVWKNLTDRNIFVVHLKALVRHIVRSLLSFDVPVLTGFFRAAFRLPGIIRIRNKQAYVLSDRDLNLI